MILSILFSWHMLVYVVVMLILLFRLFTPSDPDGDATIIPDAVAAIRIAVYCIMIVLFTAVWGGIFWW